MGKFYSTKTYGHNLGLSAAFRQFKAKSHCGKLHGYALSFKFIFETDKLDETNWCMDFGSLKPLKKYLEDTFDHKTLVDKTDPELEWFEEAHRRGIIDMVVVPATGCEMFAKMVFDFAKGWLDKEGHSPRVKLKSVEVREHGANSAIYED